MGGAAKAKGATRSMSLAGEGVDERKRGMDWRRRESRAPGVGVEERAEAIGTVAQEVAVLQTGRRGLGEERGLRRRVRGSE
jgi:hypothetical protein